MIATDLVDRTGHFMNDEPRSLAQLRDAVHAFAAERDWERFHTPKNLAISLSLEAAEVLEHFQWLTAEESARLDEAARAELAHEIGDVLIYLVRLAELTGIDPLAAACEKMALNARRYPVERSRGSAAKYDRLEPPDRRTDESP